MAKRLIETYKLGDAVEISLETPAGRHWVAGIVDGHAFPGVWVRTDGGQRWFVTNQRHIRPADSGKTEA